MSTPTLGTYADLAAQLTATTPDADADWRRRANCRNVDPELFFPVATSGTAYERQVSEARMVCWPCPVRTECLEWSITTGQKDGIWGGQDEPTRRAKIAARASARKPRKVPVPPSATPRQARGLTLLAAGYAVEDVAAVLDVAPETVTRWRQYAATVARVDENDDDVPPCGGCGSRLCEDCYGSLR